MARSEQPILSGVSGYFLPIPSAQLPPSAPSPSPLPCPSLQIQHKMQEQHNMQQQPNMMDMLTKLQAQNEQLLLLLAGSGPKPLKRQSTSASLKSTKLHGSGSERRHGLSAHSAREGPGDGSGDKPGDGSGGNLGNNSGGNNSAEVGLSGGSDAGALPAGGEGVGGGAEGRGGIADRPLSAAVDSAGVKALSRSLKVSFGSAKSIRSKALDAEAADSPLKASRLSRAAGGSAGAAAAGTSSNYKDGSLRAAAASTSSRGSFDLGAEEEGEVSTGKVVRRMRFRR